MGVYFLKWRMVFLFCSKSGGLDVRWKRRRKKEETCSEEENRKKRGSVVFFRFLTFHFLPGFLWRGKEPGKSWKGLGGER